MPTIVLRLLAILLSILQTVIGLGLLYYYLLLAASARRKAHANREQAPHTIFAVAIPAHNEASVIGETVRVARQANYPAGMFDVWVAADHCTDDTAQVAQEAGAISLERSEEPRGRKVYPLRWLIDQILAGAKRYDAIAVLDADSRIDPAFLQAMDQALSTGESVVQGKHVIAAPRQGQFSGLAGVDMRINNLLRNQAKDNLGLSCRLMGDAMCFSTDVLRRYGWPADSLGEDREYGLYLLTQRVRIAYMPEALSYGQAAPGWKEASGQRLRWYSGSAQIRKRFLGKLLRLAFQGNWGALDQVVEILLPPLSLLALSSLAIATIQALWPSLPLPFPFVASVVVVLAWALFPFLGLWIDRAPPACYQSLLYAPFYLGWRLSIGLLARLRGNRVRWVRTRRQEEAHDATH